MNWLQRILAKIGMDKIAHFFGSAFLVLACGRFIHWFIAVLVTVAVGFAKEMMDSSFNWGDILADVLGVVVGTAILLI